LLLRETALEELPQSTGTNIFGKFYLTNVPCLQPRTHAYDMHNAQ